MGELIIITSIVLIVGFVSHTVKMNKRLKLEVCKQEAINFDPLETADPITYSFRAKCTHGLDALYNGTLRNLYITKNALYIAHPHNVAIDLIISKALITEIETYTPDLPYIMNLNPAGVVANEMTRRQYGFNILIEFINEAGSASHIVLKEIQHIDVTTLCQQLEK